MPLLYGWFREHKSVLFDKVDENKILSYKHLNNKDPLEFNGIRLTNPLTIIGKSKASVALSFNKALHAICENENFSKAQLFVTFILYQF